MRRRGPWIPLTLVVALLLTLVPAYPASANPVDRLETPPTGWAVGQAGSTAVVNLANAYDENDTTYSNHNHIAGNGCGATGNQQNGQNLLECDWRGAFSRSSGVTTWEVVAMRARFHGVDMGVGCHGNNAGFTGPYTRLRVTDGNGGTVGYSATNPGYNLGTTYDVEITLTTPLTVTASGNGATVRVAWEAPQCTDTRLYTLELYSEPLIETVPIETYMVNMRVDHPHFQWTASWTWKIAWTGTLAVSSSPAGTFYTAETGGTAQSGSWTDTTFTALEGQAFYPFLHQDCFPLCQSDELTVTITDTERSQTASYTFLREDSGAVSPPTRVPRFLGYAGCYNFTADQCDDVFDPTHAQSSPAGTTDVRWRWTGSTSRLEIGPRSALDGSQIGNVQAEDDPHDEGTFILWGVTTSTSESHIWIISLENEAGQRTIGSFTLDFTSGGGGDSYTAPEEEDGETTVTCAQADVAVIGGLLCGLQALFAVSSSWLVERVSDAVDSVTELALSRQPFNFIARAYVGVSAQIERAQEDMGDTDDCPGFEIALPWSLWMPTMVYTPAGDYPIATPGPSPFIGGASELSFHILRCEDFEPLVTSSWYAPIRAAMDPALWVGYGVFWVKRLRPQPSMNG